MTYAPRRTTEQWLALIEQWQSSGQSAARFCDAQAIGYASFCSWRKRLADDQAPPAAAADQEVSFIDLGALSSSSEGRAWNIVLSLGNGVELRLSQS
tara:strand:- start:251 stop:541 length:291 start_codon:yes stop_codon:yes gene_type:complete